MSGVGGYVRRGERRYTAPAPEPDDDIPRCERCHARLDAERARGLQHFCKEFTFGTPVIVSPAIPFEVPGGVPGAP